MARRNRRSRNANQSNANKNVAPTEEELQQERSFFIWVAIITVLIVVGLYFLLF